ncbi:MAG TPA: phytanoyl-CoA dioxygenase [Candidatus Latescibacteria bacterium]|jgi:ectoine hydroxylase-related dioxygenase (phytanoyl-CoA dioxygenase family)|nr:phytanoyl-CoA dioxygenase [Candidatus Latescibacterota bacterium]|tara:strand:- start:118 stop:840 length:723 start_codon:yes stop_codon:yes gene_type:complete
MDSLTDSQIQQYRDEGFLVLPGLFSREEVAAMITHYMALRAEGPKPGDSGGTKDHAEDPNHQYPRMINMHDWDEPSSAWASRDDLLVATTCLLDDAPVLRQTMLYFKPPGGRGQGLHQDEQYICQDPLLGLWIALERADEQVGQMVVVPGSHRHGLLPVEPADTSISFSGGQTTMPDGAVTVGIDLDPGDALFFDGRIIHGSYPNRTSDRWRRSFICHYVGAHAESFEPIQGQHMSHLPS